MFIVARNNKKIVNRQDAKNNFTTENTETAEK